MTIVSEQAGREEGSCAEGEKRCSGCGLCFPATTEYFSRDKKGKNGLH